MTLNSSEPVTPESPGTTRATADKTLRNYGLDTSLFAHTGMTNDTHKLVVIKAIGNSLHSAASMSHVQNAIKMAKVPLKQSQIPLRKMMSQCTP
jgi:hypothetical protein